MAQPQRVARPRVLSIGFLTAFFGLTLLLALMVIMRTGAWWRFLFLVLPLVFGAATVVEFRRSVKSPDETLR
jgi:hypothetical protein